MSPEGKFIVNDSDDRSNTAFLPPIYGHLRRNSLVKNDSIFEKTTAMNLFDDNLALC